jgi:hypothetical protein
MISACCPQTWEHVGVMACAVKMLGVSGIGAGNPLLGRLNIKSRTVSFSLCLASQVPYNVFDNKKP